MDKRRSDIALAALNAIIQVGRHQHHTEAAQEAFKYADAFLGVERSTTTQPTNASRRSTTEPKAEPKKVESKKKRDALGTRIDNALRKAGLDRSLVAKLSQEDFVAITGLGKHARQRIIDKLNDKGIRHKLKVR